MSGTIRKLTALQFDYLLRLCIDLPYRPLPGLKVDLKGHALLHADLQLNLPLSAREPACLHLFYLLQQQRSLRFLLFIPQSQEYLLKKH